jgi:alkylation response protein AidB-like acyl-CoA dehydrogenase
VVAHAKTYLGCVGIWLGGNERQKQRLARIVDAGGQVALALTEREHGSDLLSGDVSATKVPEGYLLSGEKWLINNATRCAALTLFARTDPRGGPRGFSLFLLEKAELSPSRFAVSPKIKTLGVRGADISGIRFDNCFVPDHAMIGSPGDALETVLKGFQATRTLIPAISLGAADTALRSTLRFALNRRLYDGTVFSIPEARRTLVDGFTQILVCECVGLAAARALQAAPGRMSIWSAVTKYFVPVRIEQVIKELATVMGARHFLRHDHEWGIFQKHLRDSALAGLFDGSTVINLNAIVQQLKQIWGTPGRGHFGDEAAVQEKVFRLDASLPDFDPSLLELTNRGRDEITQPLAGFPLPELESLRSVDPETFSELVDLCREFAGEAERQRRGVLSLGRTVGKSGASREMFELARRHCVLHAAASSVWMWIHNRDILGGFFASGEWLVLGLDRLLTLLQPWRFAYFESHYDTVGEHLLRLHREDRLFSILELQLAAHKVH